MSKKIEMNYKNSSGVYEPLYPNIVASNVIDFSGTNPLLSDATKQLFNNLQNPDKVFDFLGQYNKYWWRKRNYSESGPSINPTAQKDSRGFVIEDTVASFKIFGYKSKSVTIKNLAGTDYSLDSPKSFEYSIFDIEDDVNILNALNGYYITAKYNRYETERLYYIADGNTWTIYTGSSGFEKEWVTGSLQYLPVISPYQVSIGNWEYINSTNQNAYPKNTISGGIQYEYLGIPYNNLPGGTIVNYGKYKGTGAYGSGSPNILTFSRMPKGVIIVPSGSGHEVLGAIFIQGDTQPRGMTALSSTDGYLNLNCTWNPNSISWYSVDGRDGSSKKQLNDSDTIYYWMSFE